MTRASSRPAPGVTKARDFIDRHYAKVLTIDRLSSLAGLSPFHFIRAFRRAFGQTPHQCLRDKRLERAKELLVTTTLPVTEICDQIGFQSLGSFSSLFRRMANGVLGSSVFEVDDCRKTYEELESKGVQFAGPSEERFYGIEAIMKDGQGNWFSMTQHTPQ